MAVCATTKKTPWINRLSQCWSCVHHLKEYYPAIQKFETLCRNPEITQEDLDSDDCPKHDEIIPPDD